MKYDICVFGGCSMDEIYYPETDTTLLVPGGKGSNQAIAASRAGAKVARYALQTRIRKIYH